MNAMIKKLKAFITLTGVILTSFICTSLFADDLDIITTRDGVYGNFMFIIDKSDSMEEVDDPSDGRSRMEILIDVLNTILNEYKDAEGDIRVGAAHYSNNANDSRIMVPIDEIDKDTTYDGAAIKWYELITMEENLGTSSNTPMGHGLYETVLYLRGDEIDTSRGAESDNQVNKRTGHWDYDSWVYDETACAAAGYAQDGSRWRKWNDNCGYDDFGDQYGCWRDCPHRSRSRVWVTEDHYWYDKRARGRTPHPESYEKGTGVLHRYHDGSGNNLSNDQTTLASYYNQTLPDDWPAQLQTTCRDAQAYSLNDPDCWGTYIEDWAYDSSGNKTTQYSSPAPRYISPMEDCQTTSIILLTDGYANKSSPDRNIKSLIASVTGTTPTCQDTSSYMTTYGSTTTDTDDFDCLLELAEFINTVDQDGDSTNGDQTLDLFVIGFHVDWDYLEALATAGLSSDDRYFNSRYFTANNADSLYEAFDNIFKSQIVKNLSSTGITANSFNRLTHRDELYYTLFEPSTTSPRWNGNLKRYRLDDVNAKIVDINGNSAVNDYSGYFNNGIRSWWSDSNDGDEVEEGGAADSLPTPENRNLYTNLDSSKKLYEAENQVTTGNITRTMLGASTDAERDTIINWVRGDTDGDLGTSETEQLFDAIHSTAYLVTYDKATSDEPISIAYYGDNAGFLNAFNTNTNSTDDDLIMESSLEFAFIPQELLPNLKIYYDNLATYENTDNPSSHYTTNSNYLKHAFGLDGPITIWTKDADVDGIIEDNTNDFAYLYIGMRRGGRSYYSLDVTDYEEPEYLFKITNDATDALTATYPAFQEMGQTWSLPSKTKLYNGNPDQPIEVLIFAGGYDPNLDDKTIRNADTSAGELMEEEGRAIYIVDVTDPDDPELVWSGGYTNSSHANNFTETYADMKYSIPADIRIIDNDGDGAMDLFFVGDMGGQVWGFKVTNPANNNITIEGGIIANLAADNNIAAHRRFYAPVDVSSIIINNEKYYALAIGSGGRETPLDTEVTDRFYMLWIKGTNLASGDFLYDPESFTATNPAIDMTDLYNATDNDIGEDSSVTAATAFDLGNPGQKSGWYITLVDSIGNNVGEKVTGGSYTYNGKVFFPTYEPGDYTACNVLNSGISRLYQVNAYDATPVEDWNNSGDTNLTKEDRSKNLNYSTLVSTPVHVRLQSSTDDGSLRHFLIVGTEIIDLDTTHPPEKKYWYSD